MTGNLPEVMISQSRIERRVTELAATISSDYVDKGPLVLIGVLRGAFMFLADLARAIKVPSEIDFISVSSYGHGSRQSGEVRLVMDVRVEIENKHLLIVEDIVDSGNTLRYVLDLMHSRCPASVRSCTLLYKAEVGQLDPPPDYVGFTIADYWVVGYGLDFAGRNRNLPYIGTITPDDR